ncbi:MAG: hypothetical protein CEO12_461 [Parcubacteria group bacterium Gr01-1014_46]|nr:MAG: hypothetical protein CEO12_461 [Parcubacteria group bacterium Gr01-1014_46]
MKIVVADRRGMVSSAVRSGFLQKRNPVLVVSANNCAKLENYLYIQRPVVVISGDLLQGFATHDHLGEFVKRANRWAVFVVYNSINDKTSRNVDFRIPRYTEMGAVTVGEYVADFLIANVLRGEDTTRQLDLDL